MPSEFGRGGHECGGQDERDDPNRYIDKKNPAPTPVIRDPSAERRPDDGSRYDGHAVERERCRPLLRRKCVHKDRLVHRRQPASPTPCRTRKKSRSTNEAATPQRTELSVK